MDFPFIIGLLGFVLASYSVVGNDVIQTLGTFLTSNEDRPWWVLWLYAGGILTITLIIGYLSYGGALGGNDVAFDRLDQVDIPEELSAWYLLPPAVLLLITRLAIPVSTTFLILTFFSAKSLPGMLNKSLIGYVVAFGAALLIFVGISRLTEKVFLSKPLKGEAPGIWGNRAFWTGAQWLFTGFLWSQWLTQDLANIYVYLGKPEDISVGKFIFSLMVVVGLLGYIFYSKGGAIQRIVKAKTNTADGVRQFLYRSVPYAGGDRGVAIYTDITDQFRNDRQLAVLYRILRHNLRNDLNVVGGYAELIAERTNDRFVTSHVETIVKTAERLLELSNEARDFERVLNADQTVEPIRLEPIVNRVIDTCGSRFPAGTIEQSSVSGRTVRAGEYLELALEALVDNGLRHNEAETPWVRIDATVDAGTVAISVCDNGPGIPPAERAVVTGSRSITPLEHGSGLGLWLVAAVGDVYGGHVEFAERDGGGSEVTIVLPEAEP